MFLGKDGNFVQLSGEGFIYSGHLPPPLPDEIRAQGEIWAATPLTGGVASVRFYEETH